MWKYGRKNITKISQMPDNAIGFVYEITNKTNGKKYIGKKQLGNWKPVGKKKYEEIKTEGGKVRRTRNKRKKTWNHKAFLESNWLTYTGSNKELNDDIKAGHEVEKKILRYATSKMQLTYFEVEAQVMEKVLYHPDKYYNGNILGKFFHKTLQD